MVQHALDRGYEVVGVCREQSVGKLDAFNGRITVIPGATSDRDVIEGRSQDATVCSSCPPRAARPCMPMPIGIVLPFRSLSRRRPGGGCG
jgi:hypothetical protein